MTKRILAALLTLALVFSFVPVTTFAAASNASINVADVYATPGSTVTVDVEIKDNPGVLGATLTVSWGEGLTLVGSANGEAFSELTFQAPSRYTSGCNFVWFGSEVTEVVDGTILTLTFEVPEDATDSNTYPINITYDSRDILDGNYNPVNLTVNDGSIRVVTYVPGDVTGDRRVNPLDLIKLCQFISDGCVTDPNGFNVKINESAADVNDDGRMNPLDLILISRYISDGCETKIDGYNVTLKPSTPKCDHTMQVFGAKAATCTENGNLAYWYCSKCDKYFTNETGTTEIALEDTVISASHTLSHVAATAATTQQEGCIEHWKCSACGKYFGNSVGTLELTEDAVIIPIIVRGESTVNYNVYGSDPYLAEVGIDNSANPTVFYSEDGLVLNDLIAPDGYIFKGWTTAAGTPITEIAPSTASRQIVLNATWEKVVYTVTFDTPGVSVEGKKITGETVKDYTEYTVDTGTTLKNPEWYGYTFVGWSNDEGFLVKNIKPGTTGNITLHANWTANRNIATSYTDYGDPIIIEDANLGQLLFVYNIGKIDNVPLNEIEGSYFHNIDVTEFNETLTISNAVHSDMVEGINKMISSATTQSSGWTLSNEWNDMYTTTESVGALQEKSDARTSTQGQVIGGKYFVSNSKGGSTYVSNESGGSNFNSSKVTTEESVGIDMSYDKSKEKYCDAQLGIDSHLGGSAEVGADLGITVPVPIGLATAGVNGSASVDASVDSSAGIQNGRKDQSAFHVDGSYSQYTGTVDYNEESEYYNSTASSSSNWNSTSGYEHSYKSSIEESITTEIKTQLSKTSEHSISKAVGGGASTTKAKQETVTNEEEYNTTFTYGIEDTVTSVQNVKKTFTVPGHYRYITAGTIHVYGVVGYDIATASYYTYCFNVLDDNTRQIWDYSKSDKNFQDCNNGVVTFDIPFEINEYVAGMVGKTNGLEISYNGVVTGFEPTEDFDGTVVIPQYERKDNHDGSETAVKVTSFNSNVFTNIKDDVKFVVLPAYITEIPDNAFKDCKNLEAVIAYGVTKIGNNAFAGCTALKKFYIDSAITSLGENAFKDVPEVAITAHISEVVKAAINCGAKRISLNIGYIEDSLDNTQLIIGNDGNDENGIEENPEYFALISNGKVYNNLKIVSNANETMLSNMTLSNNMATPITLESDKILLARVTITDSPSFAIIMKKAAEVQLLGSIDLHSSSKKTILSRSVTFSKIDQSTTSGIFLNGGKFLVCGTVANNNFIFDTKDNNANIEPTVISEDEFLRYFKSCTVTFDPCDGVVDIASKTVFFGEKCGELPDPTKDYYNFLGWYTATGELVTAETVFSEVGDITLYAQWELKPVTTWVKASEMPADAQVVNTEWRYTKREFTSSSESSLSGWTKYETKQTGWGAWQGPVYSNPSNGVRNVSEEKYETGRTTHWVYYRYVNPNNGYGSNNQSGSYTQYDEIDLTYQLYHDSNSATSSAVTYYKANGKYSSYWFARSYDDISYGTRWYYQDPVYTYYYYQDVSKKSTVDPTGEPDVSDVVKWVQYREK